MRNPPIELNVTTLYTTGMKKTKLVKVLDHNAQDWYVLAVYVEDVEAYMESYAEVGNITYEIQDCLVGYFIHEAMVQAGVESRMVSMGKM